MQERYSHLATLLRYLCLTSTTEAGSGHPTSCLSAADVMTVLFENYFSYDFQNPLNLANDRLVFSKGHAAPLFYALYAEAGAFPLDEMKTLRKFGSRLEGHPTSHFPFTDAATGSLGQGLSVGAGMAYLLLHEKEKLSQLPSVYVLLGDGELAEGQVWEAANFASYYKLHNLVAIADINRLAQSQETMFGHRVEEYEARFKAFGFHTIVIDGHNFDEIVRAFEQTKSGGDRPFVLIAKTYKGHGLSSLQDMDNWHGKALKKDELEKALQELGSVDTTVRFTTRIPETVEGERVIDSSTELVIDFQKESEVATREVYGKVLARLAHADKRIYALDADVKNSTFSIDFMKEHPERFIECFIAEQNMVSVAVGLSRLQKKPFVSTFAAFLTRAADQIRMAGLSHANIAFVGSHAGVSIGEDGASQMGLEDVALFGSIPNSVIFQPSDAVSASRLLVLQSTLKGISYMRTLRSKTKVLYKESEMFKIGGSKVLRSSSNDVLTLAATGITVHEALKAFELLKVQGIMVRVIDCYSVKPVDKNTLFESVNQTQEKIIITIEDHFEHGGFGDFVNEALSSTDVKTYKLAVDHVSRSGTKDELLRDAKIDAEAIVALVQKISS